MTFKAHAIEKVREFISAFDCPHDPVLWKNLMVEEANEVIIADNAVDRLKECMDFMYVCAGYQIVTPVLEDIEGTSEEHALFDWAIDVVTQVIVSVGSQANVIEAFDRVHRSNMSKLGEDGKPVRRADGKILKGPNYAPPSLDDLVQGA